MPFLSGRESTTACWSCDRAAVRALTLVALLLAAPLPATAQRVVSLNLCTDQLAMLLAARGLALLAAGNESVSVNPDNGFIDIGQGDILGLPTPGVMMVVAFVIGWVALERSVFGRHVLAVGGNEEASRLLGVHVERTQLVVYTLSGVCAGIAGVILAAQFGAGQPTEGLGWELSAIASVVVGGTLLTGGLGTIGGTLAGALLLGMIFNLLNFENGLGVISLSAYWQSVIRGVFLLVVVLLQRRLQASR